MARTIVRLYDDFATAQAVANELVNAGFARENISIMANDASGAYSLQMAAAGTADVDAGSTGTGAGIGAALGGGVGLLVGLGALAIPGIGPVIAAGPVLSALATAGVGAGIGAVAGGLVGALVDMGVPEEEAEYYAEGVRRGGAILTVHAPDEAEERAMNIINRSEAVDMNQRASWWREQGWNSFDPHADPYTPGDVAQEREAYQSYSRSRLTNDPAAATGSRGWAEVEPAPGDDSYRSDVSRTADQDSRGWAEVEPPADETLETRSRSSYPERYTTTAAGVSSPALVEDRASAEGRTDVDLNADYTWEETKGNVREGWEETKDAVREGWEETKDTVRQGWQQTKTAFDDDYDYDDTRFRQHFNTAYAGQGYTYESYAPAYRYGYDLAYDVDFDDRDWDEFEPEARQYWESNNEGPWEQFKDAVRHAWEETKETIGLGHDRDDLTEFNRQRRSSNISQ